MLTYNPHFKRILDIILAASALLVFSPLFVLVTILIKLDSEGPVFFKQTRVGKDCKPFKLIKFRSMREENKALKKQFEPGNNKRVTYVGKILRKTKIDELPELFNILIGDMSVVGPRPEVEKYVMLFQDEYITVLKVRPGLSDFASILYRDEEDILALQTDSEQYYIKTILPRKLSLACEYITNISFKTDMEIITKTIKSILF